MLVSFPSEPVIGQEFTYEGDSWKWTGFIWESLHLDAPIEIAYPIDGKQYFWDKATVSWTELTNEGNS